MLWLFGSHYSFDAPTAPPIYEAVTSALLLLCDTNTEGSSLPIFK